MPVGWLRRSADGEHYLPTLRGAYFMTWQLLWPVSWILNARTRLRGRRLLREVNAS